MIYQETQKCTAGKMYGNGDSVEEISKALGVNEHTAKGYIRDAGYSIDTRRYHKETPTGEMVLTESGQKWATEWTAVQVMFAVMDLEGGNG